MTDEPRAGDRVALAVATLLGVGRSPVAPGTAGTAVSLPCVALLGRFLPLWGFAVAALGVSLLGVWSAGRAARILGAKDPRPVVIDETAGLFMALAGIPIGWATLAGSFVLFRVMDVLKPPPARRSERLPGGWGIVADDLIAGLYANLALRGLEFLGARLAG